MIKKQKKTEEMRVIKQERRVRAYLKCDTPEHWAIPLCCCGSGNCPCHPESASQWCWCFCQSPACERSMYTDTLSQARQIYQTKCDIEIQDGWQVQKPMNTLFLLCTHPHMENRGKLGSTVPPDKPKKIKNCYFLSRNLFFLNLNRWD